MILKSQKMRLKNILHRNKRTVSCLFQRYGNKQITLYDIRAELNHRYKDLRNPYRSPTLEERFNMLTKETPSTFYIGKYFATGCFNLVNLYHNNEMLLHAVLGLNFFKSYTPNVHIA